MVVSQKKQNNLKKKTQNTFHLDDFDFSVVLFSECWGGGGYPRYLEKTHSTTGRTVQNPHRKSEPEIGTHNLLTVKQLCCEVDIQTATCNV